MEASANACGTISWGLRWRVSEVPQGGLAPGGYSPMSHSDIRTFASRLLLSTLRFDRVPLFDSSFFSHVCSRGDPISFTVLLLTRFGSVPVLFDLNLTL